MLTSSSVHTASTLGAALVAAAAIVTQMPLYAAASPLLAAVGADEPIPDLMVHLHRRYIAYHGSFSTYGLVGGLIGLAVVIVLITVCCIVTCCRNRGAATTTTTAYVTQEQPVVSSYATTQYEGAYSKSTVGVPDTAYVYAYPPQVQVSAYDQQQQSLPAYPHATYAPATTPQVQQGGYVATAVPAADVPKY
ncbi:hypothetical protein HK405_009281 [Cladochytrium tenue]|nr:hypothetical protein HK405_009281 [Cladochytrium tenue]